MIKKFNYRTLLCGLLIALPCLPAVSAAPEGYQLEQVVLFSRHGLRAPLANSGSVLAISTPKSWPEWETKGGHLTTKGGILESYFGEYVISWLTQEKLFIKDTCPLAKDTFIYANSLQRTLASAQYFTLGAFPGCEVKIFHQTDLGVMDPNFNPIIHDGSDEFKQSALAAMNTEASANGPVQMD
ncbi:histidine-type phosphatase [Jinshanibacter sp. LJY008]|uniref:Histidine-type phosphatase n=1 Tax=Limnobaculum eriocheiris TaxID=2897391 RepID=A0A9X1MUE2_9GAMM|nr:histidine-type phosphatase [Limnobaculum eriocheiris]MCD1125776.1 histidine-type phosphatase [Limnobaculum eriocheiris]